MPDSRDDLSLFPPNAVLQRLTSASARKSVSLKKISIELSKLSVKSPVDEIGQRARNMNSAECAGYLKYSTLMHNRH